MNITHLSFRHAFTVTRRNFTPTITNVKVVRAQRSIGRHRLVVFDGVDERSGVPIIRVPRNRAEFDAATARGESGITTYPIRRHYYGAIITEGYGAVEVFDGK